jgi:hypothetical protein
MAAAQNLITAGKKDSQDCVLLVEAAHENAIKTLTTFLSR